MKIVELLSCTNLMATPGQTYCALIRKQYFRQGVTVWPQKFARYSQNLGENIVLKSCLQACSTSWHKWHKKGSTSSVESPSNPQKC